MTRPHFLGPANNAPNISDVIDMFNVAKRSSDPIQRFFSLARLTTPLDKVAHASWEHEMSLVEEVRYHQKKAMNEAFSKSQLPTLFAEHASDKRGVITQEGFYSVRENDGNDATYKVSRFSYLGLRREPMIAFKSLADNAYVVTEVAKPEKLSKLERAVHEMLNSRALSALS